MKKSSSGVRVHTYGPTQMTCCDPKAGASKGGEYQSWPTMNMLTKPPHKTKTVGVDGVMMQNLYGGKRPQS